jgi:hypothetical protein
MTVKELKEALNRFDDNLLVLMPLPQTIIYDQLTFPYPYAHITNVTQGVNELDGCVFLDDYEEDDEDD